MSKLRVFIIEEHTEAYEVLHLAARRGLIHLRSCRMVHFDSHPDLSCFDHIQPEHLTDRTELCHRLRNSEDGISSFILPAIAVGLLKDIVWIKPPWTNQIPTGNYPGLVFGWTSEDTGCKMAIASELDYWADDGNSVPCQKLLSNQKSFDLLVCSLEDWISSNQSRAFLNDQVCGNGMSTRSSSSHKTKHVQTHWVLDICLDYFSCSNPLQEPDLPEHISSSDEIKSMLTALRDGLQALLSHGLYSAPALCIIARSEEDGFTPGEVAADLEEAVIAVLHDVYGDLQLYPVKSHEDFYNSDFIRSV